MNNESLVTRTLLQERKYITCYTTKFETLMGRCDDCIENTKAYLRHNYQVTWGVMEKCEFGDREITRQCMSTHHRIRKCMKAQDDKYVGGILAVEQVLFVRDVMKGIPLVRIAAYLQTMNITEMPVLIEK